MDDLTAKKPCPGCGKEGFHTKYMGSEGKRMEVTGECFECAYWELRCEKGEELVIDNYVYGIGTEPSEAQRRSGRGMLGMGGRRFDIEFFDGRKFTTHNLWAGGLIPERYRERLPNTAKFISGERADASGTTCWNPADERAPAHPTYR